MHCCIPLLVLRSMDKMEERQSSESVRVSSEGEREMSVPTAGRAGGEFYVRQSRFALVLQRQRCK